MRKGQEPGFPRSPQGTKMETKAGGAFAVCEGAHALQFSRFSRSLSLLGGQSPARDGKSVSQVAGLVMPRARL